MRAILAAAGAIAVLFVACGGGAKPPPSVTSSPAPTPTAAASCPPARPRAAGETVESIESGGLTRSYILRVPAGYDGSRPAGLVLLFHPFASNARFFLDYAAFGSVADAAGLVLIAPEGTGSPQFWNMAAVSGAPDDVALTRDLVAMAEGSFCIDDARVFAAGYSNGAGMVLRDACELPDTFAAIAVVASAYVSCTAPVPLIAFHGTADPLLPFNGGQLAPDAGSGDFPPVRRAVSEWARALGCDPLPLISRAAPSVELSTFQRCALGDGEALLYSLIGGGHTWPGATLDLPATAGSTNREVDATSLIAAFFAAHAPPRPDGGGAAR